MTALATYSFLPWLRQGLANQITSADFDPTVKTRVQIQVQLELVGAQLGGGTQTAPVGRGVALFGPGDLQGIDARAIVRVEPRNWITNFEPNYLACIEFYDEDFPWRYTPAAPDTGKGRLRPWIMLVVLPEGEFTEGTDIRGKPLPYVDVRDVSVFPPADQLWAWAHVHVNRSLAGSDTEFTSNDMGAVLPRLQALLNENPDLAYSRIVSPRKLAETTAYHAFLVPTFETGRLAGLGLDPEGTPGETPPAPNATFSAWASYPDKPQAQSFPYYHRWFFCTATTGDFESLVRLLQPKPVDKRVGTRAMDVLAPGSNLPGITDPVLNGVLKLGGALQVPREDFTSEELVEVDKYENWAQPYPRPFQEAMARLVDLADDYATVAAGDANSASGLGPDVEDDPDPLITPPLYGAWHALTKRLLVNRDTTPISPNDNWVHELNLDPRHRVAAGFGTRVVQEQQEQYMNGAWEQIGRVLEANQRIRLGQLGEEVSFIWYDRHIRPLLRANPQQATLVLAPLSTRVRAGEFTVHHVLSQSLVQPAMASAGLRRVMRPRARLARTLPFTETIRPGDLLARVNAREVSAAPPRVTPPDLPAVQQVADQVLPTGAPRWVLALLRRWPWLRWMPLALAALVIVLLLLFAPGAASIGVAAAVAAGGLFAFRRLSRWARALRASDRIREDNLTPTSVDALPRSPDFVLSEPGAGFTPRSGGTDSVEATRFKAALRDSFAVLAGSAKAGAVPARAAVGLGGITQAMFTAIDPDRTIPTRVLGTIVLPPRIRGEIGEAFVEAMAYPEFDSPMYEPLKDISAELFLPNINLVAQNSITLLETNQKFIEAYMVGLNHEFARELLWREYPTDQRGSYFRQFWDARGYFNAENLDDQALKEQLRDIPRLDRWSRPSKLGEHDNRDTAGQKAEAVLVIRGELLKRYPTAVIFAHRACWQRKGDGNREPCLRSGEIDSTVERLLIPLTPAEEGNPPRTKVRTPLYEAKVDPDIYFFGFDLTVEEARGGTGADPNDDPGWFFVIKERPGEPRFGLDIDQQPELNVWNDLSWQDVQPGPPGSYLQISNATASLALVPPGGPEAEEKLEQYQEDRNVSWNSSMSSADLAYVLFQAPVLVAVHASEMLAPR
jgi:hypothetical protein